MAKTYEVVVFDDDGKGVTSAITVYDRDDNGLQTYVGREFLDAEETEVVLDVVADGLYRRRLAHFSRSLRPAMDKLADRLMRDSRWTHLR